MIKTLCVILVGLISFYANSAYSLENKDPIQGVGIDRSRIVISNGEQTASYGVRNNLHVPLLASAWVTDLDGKVTSAFVVNPSVFQLQSGRTGKAQIRLIEKLPDDRESIFWLTVNTISQGQAEKNQIKVALGQKIKVFYRPKGLKGNTKYAANNLKWSYSQGKLTATNPTALSVTISDFFYGDKEAGFTGMVLPFSDYSWNITDIQKIDSFSIIDEYGGEVKFPLSIGK